MRKPGIQEKEMNILIGDLESLSQDRVTNIEIRENAGRHYLCNFLEAEHQSSELQASVS